ncbi:GNAT family N-acetyltransferase [Aeromicrobium duanguangcaii]|uniref:GNAT family N-acetyltransferase n=1 Tax=Aeromicrobium duanguangcaii TaxID=2968086 RepID=A0ABY5KEK8_9ACTN|nr:GNAT family N-acetyltransferase [Aeromicrobium duanguangcaii]MCL3837387.1 GNAT family N-acetyltransferase [Aeromicrobium duanguangcaii]UUI67416.1 GNAT family N-acetyltransferase [Aeromicrobium duanguangcaii]
MALRHPVEIRDVELDDASSLIKLWVACAEAVSDEGSEAYTQQTLWRCPDEAEARAAIEFNAREHRRRLIVALVGGELVGAVAADLATLNPITMCKVMIVTDLQVKPSHRRRSIASSLLSVVAAYAEEQDCELVLANSAAHAREPNRYLTKLGFNQIAVLRAIPVGKLNARLATKSSGSRETGRLLAVRRSLRRRAAVRG